MTDPRLDLLDHLIRLTQADLRSLRAGRLDFTEKDDPRVTLLDQLRALDRELGLPEAPSLVKRLQTLQQLNDALRGDIQRLLDETKTQMKGVARGRQGMTGYLGTARGAGGGAKLGKG